MRAFVAVTDPAWLRQLGAIGATEANFWQPRPTPLNQPIGTPWIFKVRGQNRVGGYGIYSYYTLMPAGIAWESFGEQNGVASFAEMRKRLGELSRDRSDSENIGCVVLSNLCVLEEERYIAAPDSWKPNTVRAAYYDLNVGEGARMWAQLMALQPPALISALPALPGGYADPRLYKPRRGQGAFRLMVIDAYQRRCAITGEGTLPALEAAHLRPFAETESHEVRNGVLMRSDLHRLFDQGYVTITPDLRFRVSTQIRDQFHNGVIYYDLHDREIRVPQEEALRPDRSALEWHASTTYRA